MFDDEMGFCAPPRIEWDMPPLRLDVGPMELAILKDCRWYNKRELLVRFLDGDPLTIQRVTSIILGPEGWSAACGLPLRIAAEGEEAEIRVTFAQKGNWSYLGTQALGIPEEQPTMCLASVPIARRYAEQRRVVLHEFGHALGFIHEHSTPRADIPWDTEEVTKYFQTTYGWSRALVEVNVLRRWTDETVIQHEYDRDSIMHYMIEPRFLRDKSWAGGGQTVLSPMDKLRAQEWYGAPAEYWSEALG